MYIPSLVVELIYKVNILFCEKVIFAKGWTLELTKYSYTHENDFFFAVMLFLNCWDNYMAATVEILGRFFEILYFVIIK